MLLIHLGAKAKAERSRITGLIDNTLCKIGIKIQYPSDWEGTKLNRYIGNGLTRIVEFGLPFEKPSRYGRYKQMLAIDFRGSYSTSLPLDIYVCQRIFLLSSQIDLRIN